jgi:hypothetical protein
MSTAHILEHRQMCVYTHTRDFLCVPIVVIIQNEDPGVLNNFA